MPIYKITYMLEGSQKQYSEEREAKDGRHLISTLVTELAKEDKHLRYEAVSYVQKIDL